MAKRMNPDRSTNEIVVEYAVQEMMKGKSPASAARATAKKHSGYENMFFGPGITVIDAGTLENALWGRLTEFTIRMLPKLKAGKEHYALDGTLAHFNQKPSARRLLKARVVDQFGYDPFVADDNPAQKKTNAPERDPRRKLSRKDYPAIFGDIDTDRIEDADDPRPQIFGDIESIEEVKLVDEMDGLLAARERMLPVEEALRSQLRDLRPQLGKFKIKSRTKTPYSMINKLRRKKLPELTDMVGGMLVAADQKQLDKADRIIEREWDVIDREDFYAKPQNGYRAIHYTVRIDGHPVELQLKTWRMSRIADFSHTAYKRGDLNADAMEQLTSLAWKADQGDKSAAAELDPVLDDPQKLKARLRGTNPRVRSLARRLANGG